MKRGTNSHPITCPSRFTNITLHLAMTRKRILGFQWVKETLTHVEVFHFFHELLTRFPVVVRNRSMNRTLPADLEFKDDIKG